VNGLDRLRRRARALVGKPRKGAISWMARSWTAADLRPLPEGSHAGPPHFVGVGTPKAGTSWWYSLVTRHPHVLPNRFHQKELQFFARTDAFDPPEPADAVLYRQAFPCGTDVFSGEWTPNYLSHPRALERLVSCAPEARLLLLVRDPVDRLQSHLNHQWGLMERLGLSGDEAAFTWRYFLYPDAVRASFVADNVERLLSLVPRDRLLVLQYEQCRDDPEEQLHRTLAFLEVDPAPSIDAIRAPVNSRPRRFPAFTPQERGHAAELFETDATRVCRLLPELDGSRWHTLARQTQ
jgi:hypothetical protein